MKRRQWQLFVGLLISLIFLAIALRDLELTQVGSRLRGADYRWLVPTIFSYFITVGARAWRWQYLLRPLAPISFRSLFGAVVVGYLGNNIYPFRIGEVLRVYVVHKREAIAMSTGLATLFVERVFDGLAVLLLVFVALPFTPLANPEMQSLVWITSGLFLGAMALFLGLAMRPTWAQRVVGGIGRFLPQSVQAQFSGLTAQFLAGLTALRHPGHVFLLFLTSVAIWLVEVFKYWLVMQAFAFTVPFGVLMLANGIINLTTILPSAPGFVGTFDLPGIAVLVLFGVGEEMAAAYTFVLHLSLWLPSTVFGAVYMAGMGFRWADFGRAAERPC